MAVTRKGTNTMTYFIKLTRFGTTEEVFVNLAEIAELASKGKGTGIHFAGGSKSITVAEIARDIIKMIPAGTHRPKEFMPRA
jgi:hypothetical protein